MKTLFRKKLQYVNDVRQMDTFQLGVTDATSDDDELFETQLLTGMNLHYIHFHHFFQKFDDVCCRGMSH
jgi:hypothetical protein